MPSFIALKGFVLYPGMVRVRNISIAAALALLFLLPAQTALASCLSEIYLPAPGFKKIMLSAYYPPLKGTPADTPVFIQQGGQKGGVVLVVGGTHANEVAGTLAALMFVENAKVKKGRLIILPRANMAASGHSAPRQKKPLYFEVDLPGGAKRWFRYGSRYSKSAVAPSRKGEKTPSRADCERTNLNRVYPGRADGCLTEQTAYAIVQLLKKEKVDLAIDLHEARQKSRLADMAVVHERALDFAAEVLWDLSGRGVEIRLDASPKKAHGLSHREWGDNTGALAVLLESRNPLQINQLAKYPGFVAQDGKKDEKLCADFERFFASKEGASSLALRVGRHVEAVAAFIRGLKDADASGTGSGDKEVIVDGIPSLKDLQQKGVGAYLNPPPAK